jgi:dTDP-4-amino-4,6-dideoxygalactose transaminase
MQIRGASAKIQKTLRPRVSSAAVFHITMKVPLLDLSEQNAKLRPEIEAALGRVLDTNAFILGGEVRSLEGELAEYCGAKYAVGCASGSDALVLALMAVGVEAGDEVITTPYSFFASVSAITRLGATPVFADIDPETYNIDAARIEEKITSKTKAIEPVHLYGQCSDMDALLTISEKNGIPIVEDAAQAIGAEDKGRRAGSMGAAGCFSFYPSKNLGGMGDGGFCTTNDEATAHKLFALRVHGAEERYYHKWIGLNSRLDGFQGAVLRVKLPHLDAWTEARRANAALYREALDDAESAGHLTLPKERGDVRHIYNQFVIRVPGRRDELRQFLGEKEIGTDIYYPLPLHLQECFAYLGGKKGDLPEAEKAAEETLAIPVFPELKPEQINYVAAAINEFFKS